jgi:hypothetical protein
MFPLERRMKALEELLKLERPTSKALAYSEWFSSPQVVIELEEANKYYNK